MPQLGLDCEDIVAGAWALARAAGMDRKAKEQDDSKASHQCEQEAAPIPPSSCATTQTGCGTSTCSRLVSPGASSSVGPSSSFGGAECSTPTISSKGDDKHRRAKHKRKLDVAHLRLFTRFLDLCELSEDMDGSTTKLLLRCIDMLYRCKYSTVDLCSILAHASAYFRDAYKLCGNSMDSSEVGNVLVLIIFIAHCYVQDETCPLKVWHKHLFKRYCSLETLDAAVIRIMEIRGFVLRVPDAELERGYAYLSNKIVDSAETTQ